MVDAKKVKDMVSKRTSKVVSQFGSGTSKVPPHKHCRICHEPISVKAEPRVCNDQECIDKHEQDDKNQRTVRIAMFVFFGLFAIPYLLTLVMRLVG
ncbi:MAG: DUF2116 family Zn-ribbon domain-containing protein [Candidatus Poseidoniales archaeon]|nr:MAG: DUF2116 family Zn-ribbon domain-containing protein [Candidatus Poseidoniales archaeon]